MTDVQRVAVHRIVIGSKGHRETIAAGDTFTLDSKQAESLDRIGATMPPNRPRMARALPAGPGVADETVDRRAPPADDQGVREPSGDETEAVTVTGAQGRTKGSANVTRDQPAADEL